MNIYLVTRTDKWGYDEFDSIIVATKNVYNAKRIKERDCFGWTTSDYLEVELIGVGNQEKECIILESFNAG